MVSDTEEGGSTITGSSALNCVVSMKKVTSRNARSTMGVMSRAGLLRGIFIFGMSAYFEVSQCFAEKV
jgi:hypothetical protein